MARRQEQAMNIPQPTKEEVQLIREISNRHALYNFPVSLVSMNAWYLYCKRTNRKFLFRHCAGIFIFTSAMTMISARYNARKQLLEKFPDGAFALMWKTQHGYRVRENVSDLENTETEEKQRNYSGNMDFSDRAQIPEGLDDRFRPTVDDFQKTSEKKEDVEQQKKYTSYSELRKQNRQQNESSLPVKRNKYGDIITDE
ncbi:hypothetical protein KUTeg_001876 [Tegillarca granosa]|uniref:HIG1 domain-containing protein n=1 Tax=Tegillarca granosa TaxID=220873 RepID=A0ABQ9FSP2_TEGGR|nr:hypothetical protein KUTeg_001876 [Tegillarca granosa]